MVIVNAEGNRLTPSVVAFAKDGQRLVGQLAKRQAVLNPENTIYSIKRFIGRRVGEVPAEAKLVPYRVVAGPNEAVRVRAGGKEYPPEEIAAMVLRTLVDDASRYLGEKVKERRHHRAGLLQRRPAAGHEGRGEDRGLERPPDHQRADGRRAGLRVGQAEERDDPGLRPGGRDVRRLHLGGGRRRLRSESHQR